MRSLAALSQMATKPLRHFVRFSRSLGGTTPYANRVGGVGGNVWAGLRTIVTSASQQQQTNDSIVSPIFDKPSAFLFTIIFYFSNFVYMQFLYMHNICFVSFTVSFH